MKSGVRAAFGAQWRYKTAPIFARLDAGGRRFCRRDVSHTTMAVDRPAVRRARRSPIERSAFFGGLRLRLRLLPGRRPVYSGPNRRLLLIFRVYRRVGEC